MFAKGDHLFKYDLKEAYHHIEILEEHRKFLGFSWNFENNGKYFVFNVLPFGLASGGHTFTKVLKKAIKYWRNQSVKIIMYLDDGLGGANDFFSAERSSSYIRTSLSELGFLIAEDKCIWYPQQDMIRIGLVWDMKSGKFRIANERVDILVNVIEKHYLMLEKIKCCTEQNLLLVLLVRSFLCKLFLEAWLD